jgi:hypothetical protein
VCGIEVEAKPSDAIIHLAFSKTGFEEEVKFAYDPVYGGGG